MRQQGAGGVDARNSMSLRQAGKILLASRKSSATEQLANQAISLSPA
jgi:hypothetical protein